MRKMYWFLAALAVLASTARAEVYQIDPVHSSVSFRVAHMVISKVTGRFEKFSGTIRYEKGNPKAWGAEASIDASSVNTDVEARDKHLRSSDFLDVEKFPQISFKSTKAAEVKGDSGKLYGNLTIHGVTKPVVLDLEIGGVAKDPWGNMRIGATATTKIDRRDFGIIWNKALDSGGVLVGNDVEITLSVEGVLQKSAKAG